MMRYYVDTCILLNIWKKEIGHDRTRPFWRSSKEFLESNSSELAISTVVFRELELKLGPVEFQRRKNDLENLPRIALTEGILAYARKLESQEQFSISFSDILHALLAQKNGLTLVTRDRKLIALCRRIGVAAARPEECRYR